MIEQLLGPWPAQTELFNININECIMNWVVVDLNFLQFILNWFDVRVTSYWSDSTHISHFKLCIWIGTHKFPYAWPAYVLTTLYDNLTMMYELCWLYFHVSGTVYCKGCPYSLTQLHLFRKLLGEHTILDHAFLLLFRKCVLPSTIFELAAHVLKLLVGHCTLRTTTVTALFPPLPVDHLLYCMVAPPATILFHNQLHLQNTNVWFIMMVCIHIMWWYQRLWCTADKVHWYIFYKFICVFQWPHSFQISRQPDHLVVRNCHLHTRFIIDKELAAESPVPHSFWCTLAIFLLRCIVGSSECNRYINLEVVTHCITRAQGSCINGWVQVWRWQCAHGNIIYMGMWQGCVHANFRMELYMFQRDTQHMYPHTSTGSLEKLHCLGQSSCGLFYLFWWASWWTMFPLLDVCLEGQPWSLPTSAWAPEQHAQHTHNQTSKYLWRVHTIMIYKVW